MSSFSTASPRPQPITASGIMKETHSMSSHPLIRAPLPSASSGNGVTDAHLVVLAKQMVQPFG